MNRTNRTSRWLLASLLLLVSPWLQAFQIGPLGTQHEERLTNETNSSLSRVADKLGVLIKGRVHEEITHLGSGCLTEPAQLPIDLSCSGSNVGVASPFVIYGVRWNDLPPFRLGPEQGNCAYFGRTNVCRTEQTVRFSTQPMCWYCLFKDAEAKAQTKRIVGCSKAANTIPGNLMTRSHFGDLQFLHAMANAKDIHPVETRAYILDWLEFAWKVSTKEVPPQTYLKNIQIPAIQKHFGCTEWKVADLYLLGRQDAASRLLPQIREIAFGSVLHTVQDSFSAAHVEREGNPTGQMCEGTPYAVPPRVVEFHAYAEQDGSLHDQDDRREAMTSSPPDQWPEAVVVTRNLFELHADGAKWKDASTYMQCLFTLSNTRRSSSPGEAYRRQRTQQP